MITLHGLVLLSAIILEISNSSSPSLVHKAFSKFSASLNLPHNRYFSFILLHCSSSDFIPRFLGFPSFSKIFSTHFPLHYKIIPIHHFSLETLDYFLKQHFLISQPSFLLLPRSASYQSPASTILFASPASTPRLSFLPRSTLHSTHRPSSPSCSCVLRFATLSTLVVARFHSS